jgi:hypothetical protein
MCKADYVQYVKEIISKAGQAGTFGSASLRVVIPLLGVAYVRCGLGPVELRQKQFDITLFWYIIYITYGLFPRRQTPPPPSTGRPAPTSPSSYCGAVPGQQFLRSQRFDPGQIRDAATGPSRTDPGQPGRPRGRALAALFLPGSGSHATKRPGGIDSAKTWTARRHKLTVAVLGFLDRQRASQPKMKFAELARLVQNQLGVTVHPRTIERVLSQRQKKRR